jgi:A/G-specific adenine glycosylase
LLKKHEVHKGHEESKNGVSSCPLCSSWLRRWVRRRLALWFARHARALPWRKNRDPFAIWISEIMLQQTQVATVVPYFQRFLQAFPTVSALAAADEQQVLRLWEGLGYYRRARDLHQAARRLAAEHGAVIPNDPVLFRSLPGIGRYTVGAVLSQAYDRRLPILEANSQRVLCRLLGLRDDPRSALVQRRLWQAARELLPRRGAGDFNQALMELGALVCTSAAPACEACPLARHCAARRLGLQERIPLRVEAPAVVAVREVAIVVHRGPRVLVVQRPSQGRWPRMWEVPHGALAEAENHEQAAARLLPDLTAIEAQLGPELLTIRHAVTRFASPWSAWRAIIRPERLRRLSIRELGGLRRGNSRICPSAFPSAAWRGRWSPHASSVSFEGFPG